MARFGRVLTAMISPFDESGALDVDGAVELAKWLVEQGNEGLVVSGTTGESPTLSIDEKLTLFETVASAVTVPIIAGTTGSNTIRDIHLTGEAGRLGIAGVLGVCPYYSRPSQAGIEAHFRAIADTTDLPVMLYDIPGRTGRKISTETIIRLAKEVTTVVALKDAAGNPGATSHVIQQASNDFEVYSGDDSLTLPLLSVGAVGIVGVATHWCALDMREMFDAWSRRDIGAARKANDRMLESFVFETGDDTPNPIPAKAMMRMLGQPAGEPRLPMGPIPAGLEHAAQGVYDRLLAARG